MTENCKHEVRETEKQRMTPRFLVWVTVEMVSPTENGREKGELFYRGGGWNKMCLDENEVPVGHSGGDRPVDLVVSAGDRHLEVKCIEADSGCGLDHQGRGCRVRGHTCPRRSSEERTFVSKATQHKRCFPFYELSWRPLLLS